MEYGSAAVGGPVRSGNLREGGGGVRYQRGVSLEKGIRSNHKKKPWLWAWLAHVGLRYIPWVEYSHTLSYNTDTPAPLWAHYELQRSKSVMHVGYIRGAGLDSNVN